MENDCHRNSECVNNEGSSYDCNCHMGFTGNGTECTGMYEITSLCVKVVIEESCLHSFTLTEH